MRTTIDSYLSRAGRLDTEGIDLSAFADRPLSPAGLRCLRYMHDVEHHTVCYLRDLLMSPAHRDPEVTSFLACWVFEELWHGEALGRRPRGPRRAGGRRPGWPPSGAGAAGATPSRWPPTWSARPWPAGPSSPCT